MKIDQLEDIVQRVTRPREQNTEGTFKNHRCGVAALEQDISRLTSTSDQGHFPMSFWY